MDGLGTYTCYCPRGYSGRFCEIAPLAVNNHFSYNSLCQSHACQNNGVCYVPNGGSHYMCQCAPGTNYSSLFSDLCIFSFTYHLIPLTQSFSLSDSMLSLEHSYIFFLQKHGKSATYFAYYSGQPTSYMYIFKKNVFMFSAISMNFFCKVPAYMMNRQLCIFLYMYISSCSQTYTCTLNFDC